MNSQTYKKRAGTSGIQGHLYETKLISLIYFRLIHDDSVEQFSLATNRDDVGAFDDISFIANVKGFEKPLAVFLQAKHKENDKLLTFISKTDLVKYFESYLEIRRNFNQNYKDMFFRGKFEETECIFVMYTTAKEDPSHKVYEGTYAGYLNELIGTAGCCTQPSYTDDDLDILCKIVMKEQITTLAEQLTKFICYESNSEMSMNNDIMLRYHVVLAINVFKVSEIQAEGYRIASFREDFFTTNGEFIVLIKNILCLGVLKKQNSEETDVQSLLLKFLREPSDVKTLSKLLIGRVLKFKNEKLEFTNISISDDLKRRLDKANVPKLTVYEAAELAAKKYLLSLKLKVPAFFGNTDLAIRGNDKKIKKRLNYLTTKIQEILEQSKPNHIITIDESLGDGFLQLNGGIASAVGNIIVYDKTSKLLKFTDTSESLGKLAKTWYVTLKSKIPNLHKYKLDVKVNKFPKLSFDGGQLDKDLVKDFYNKLLFYTNQADQNRIEEILKAEIENHSCCDVKNFKGRSGLIFLEYHDKIQKLWMTPKVGSYLTKKSKIYEGAVTYAMSQTLNGVYKNMHNMKYQDFTFNEDAIIKWFQLHRQIIGSIIVSESCVLTLAKVEQYLGNKDHIVLDLENIFKLPLKTHNTLCKELTNTAKEKIFIIVCNTFQDCSHCYKRLETIATAVDGKQIIVITLCYIVEIITKYFTQASNVWNDERNSFTDLTIDSQKKFIATSKIKFQGEDVSLDTIVDVKSMKYINDGVFHKIMNNETVEVGYTPVYSNYEKLFYIDRRVSCTTTRKLAKFLDVKNKVIKTLHDLEDDIVLIIAKRRMGKSTLLSHLILKTKELDPKAWVVRINLQENKTNNNNRIFKTYNKYTYVCWETIRDIALGDESMELTLLVDGYIKLFQHQIFIDYHTRGKLIFVFDGFDEINAKYKIVFAKWLKKAKDRGIKNKIWITATSSSKLDRLFVPSYIIQNFSRFEQKTYLNKLWKFKIQFKNLNTKAILNIEDFVGFMHLRESKSEYLRIYVEFLNFLKTECLNRSIDFPYDDYYNHFKTKFGLSNSTIPYISDDTTPEYLCELATELLELKRWIAFKKLIAFDYHRNHDHIVNLKTSCLPSILWHLQSSDGLP